MSLRSKIILVLVGVVLLYAGIDNVSLRMMATPVFEEWERRDGERDLSELVEGIDGEIRDLSGKAAVYAGLEPLRRFLEEPDGDAAAFVREDLTTATLDELDVDVLYVCSPEGKVLFGEVLDPRSRASVTLRELPNGSIHRNRPIFNFARDTTVTGLMMTEHWPLLISSTAVAGAVEGDPASDEFFRGATYGSVILGRFLDVGLRGAIEEDALADLRVMTYDEAQTDSFAGPFVEQLTSSSRGIVVDDGDEERLRAFTQIPDLRTGTPLVLEATVPREISLRGRQGMNYALVSSLTGSTFVLFVLLRLLQKIVIRPLSTLTKKAVEIGRQDDTTIRVEMDGDDEIGQLAREFDDMLEKLAKSREQVVQTARMAGMSEIATGVLHNVGNVLNSVNVSANMVTRLVDQLSVEDVKQIVEVLESQGDKLGAFITEDPRGKHLLPFLSEVAQTLLREKEEISKESLELREGVEHIAELVRSQQTYAVSKGVFEKASLQREVENALKIANQSSGPSERIEVVKDFEPLPSVMVDKHKLMEILINLLQNAKQAVREAGDGVGTITVRIHASSTGYACIEVQDTGTGISEANLSRVFQHGFTTKKDGHGFGLHVSANAATELGGALSVRSDGAGHGATFILEIPLQREESFSHAA